MEQAEEALRLAKARLDAGAGVQLDVLNAQVQLLTAQSTRLQALFGYNSSLAEFDRATGAQSSYQEMFADLAPRATKRRPTTPAVVWTPKGNGKKLTTTTAQCELRLEGLEHHIPNKALIRIPNRPLATFFEFDVGPSFEFWCG